MLVDYCNILSEGEDENTIDSSIFVDDMCDNGVFNMVVCNDTKKVNVGRSSNTEQ